eukprot:41726_1
MGCCFTCCTTCNCPKNVDTAIGRRKILDDSQSLIESHIYKSLAVKISTEYVNKPDGSVLYTKLFEPKDAKDAKAMICYCIGFSDHVSYITQDVGVKYAELGFIVFMCDWRGHGRSDGKFIHIKDFDTDIVDEGCWVFNYAINKYIKSNKIYREQIDKNNNYFLSGASMGGAITIKMALKAAENDEKYIDNDETDNLKTALLKDKNTKTVQKIFNKWKGIILVCPMVAIKEELRVSGCQEWCLINCCLPCCPKIKVIPNKVIDALTKDKVLQQKVEDNPLKYEQSLSIITGYNLLRATQSIEANVKKLKIPMFICHGDDDMITDCKMSQAFYNNCGCDQQDKTIKIYEGKGHLLYGENPNLFSDVVGWMTKRMNVH